MQLLTLKSASVSN